VTRLLVLAAVDVEARSLARHLGLPSAPGPSLRFAAGGLEVAVIGLAGAYLGRVAPPAPGTLVVSAGACGALAPELAVGALVVPETVITPDERRLATAALPGLARQGALVSAARVVEDAAAKSRLWLSTGALAVDMESAAILAWAAVRDVPAAVVRGVADTAGAGIPEDLASVVGADGTIRTARALRVALARPRALPEALALRHATNAALDGVAAVLAAVARRA